MAEGSDALMDQLGPEQHLDGLAEGSDALTDQLGPEERRGRGLRCPYGPAWARGAP